MMDSENNHGVRRRPPTAPYTTAASHSYGTTGEEESPLLSSHNEEGYPMMQPYIERRRMSGINNPWYRQPHKLMLAAALMWVGSVMYLASLAHAILRTHKETSHMMMGSSMVDNDENFKQWLESQGMLKKSYGSSASDEHVTQWLESRSNNNKYGASGETNEDFQKWLESQNKYGASSSSSSGSSTVGLGDAYQDWLQYLKDNKYGASSTKINSGDKANNVNVRFGNNNAPPQEWLEYQTKNEQVKYSANGMYDKSQKSVNNLAASRAMAKSSQSLTSDQQQQRQPVTATSDSSVSTIDWPLQGMPHASCTNSNGCSSSSNVTVLIVYGPEYHTHISEMAWNVATGVHTAFQNHIKHHPSSPMHGHIVYGHTGNVTFLDVMDADAIIIGSPVYNGNVHPDVQNWINYWHIDADLENKFGGAFATAGGIHAGADGTIMSILRSMMVFQMMAVGGDSWTSPFGAVATMYEDPFGDTRRTSYFDSSCYYTGDDGRQGDHLVHPYFLRKAYGLGERIANVTVAWKNSSYVRWS